MRGPRAWGREAARLGSALASGPRARAAARSAGDGGALGAKKPLRKLRVAAVLDEFSQGCFAPEVTLLPLDASYWRLQLGAFRPDFLFVESAWRGPNDSWRYRVASYPKRGDNALAKLVAACQARDIPTVFWNKEDPAHFDRFIDAAKLFDYVFTTDADLLDVYRDRCQLSTDRVGALMFAVQPEIYNPVGAKLTQGACFSGSYGERSFPERRRELEMLLDAAAPFGLDIYDRNSAVKASEKAFPPRYAPHLRDAVAYPELADIYRGHGVCLNVNTVRESSTMFSRRVFESLACGTPVLSSPSRGMETCFADLVQTAESKSEATIALQKILEAPNFHDQLSSAGIRRVLREHTYTRRMQEICAAIGVTVPTEIETNVALLAFVHDHAELERFVRLVSSQTARPHTVVVAVRGDDATSLLQGARDFAASTIANGLQARAIDARSDPDEHSACRRIAGAMTADYVACVALQHEYADDFLESRVVCTTFLAADLIGTSSGDPRIRHDFSNDLHPHSLMIARPALARVGWSSCDRDVPALRRELRQLRGYAIDEHDFHPKRG